jgi:membrane protein YdbS with pleckstrin-like domain
VTEERPRPTPEQLAAIRRANWQMLILLGLTFAAAALNLWWLVAVLIVLSTLVMLAMEYELPDELRIPQLRGKTWRWDR